MKIVKKYRVFPVDILVAYDYKKTLKMEDSFLLLLQGHCSMQLTMFQTIGSLDGPTN